MKLKTIIKSSFAVVVLALALQSCADSKKEEKIAPKVEATGADTKAMKCEPGKCGDAMKGDKTDKAAKKDGKCGDGKCGDSKTDKAAKTAKDTMKCGAGKCGDAMKKDNATKETKQQ